MRLRLTPRASARLASGARVPKQVYQSERDASEYAAVYTAQPETAGGLLSFKKLAGKEGKSNYLAVDLDDPLSTKQKEPEKRYVFKLRNIKNIDQNRTYRGEKSHVGFYFLLDEDANLDRIALVFHSTKLPTYLPVPKPFMTIRPTVDAQPPTVDMQQFLMKEMRIPGALGLPDLHSKFVALRMQNMASDLRAKLSVEQRAHTIDFCSGVVEALHDAEMPRYRDLTSDERDKLNKASYMQPTHATDLFSALSSFKGGDPAALVKTARLEQRECTLLAVVNQLLLTLK